MKRFFKWLKRNLLKKMHDKYKFLFNDVYTVKYNDDIKWDFSYPRDTNFYR